MFTNVTLLYFVLLIPLSGFIAWLGDRIGHKSGKRRHTLFGLRPRHTAMVFTVGTGMCISLVSFLLVYLFSATFRMIVRDGVRLYDTNRELKHDNIRLDQGNARLARVAAERQLEAENADRKRAEALAARAKADAAAQTALAAEASAVADQKKAEAEVSKALGQLANEKKSLSLAQGSLHSVQGALKDRSASLRSAQARVDLVQKQVDAATRRALVAQHDADAAQSNVERVRRIASGAIQLQTETLTQQNKALAALRQQFDDETKLYENQKTATDQQRQELVALNTQVADSEKRLQLIQLNTEALRGNHITYQVGEEVARIAIKPGYNVWRIEAILGSFLAKAAKDAESRGARKDKNGDSALVILPQDIQPSTDAAGFATASVLKANPKTVNEDVWMDETVRAAASAIRTENTDEVVIATAVANAVAGEPVAISLKWYKNPIVFPADAQIGDAHINGKGSPEEIANALYTFLRTGVRPTLLHAGVIPRSPGGTDAETTPALASLSPDDWLHIMDRIRLAGDNARVVVTASQDMRAGDFPVPLRFDVKGVPANAFRDSPW